MGLVYLMTFLSGCAALIYEILWTRQFTLVLGNTTASISTVVGAFMAGLALGSAAIGRWADRWRRHLAAYAVLEAAIGVSALGILAGVSWLDRIYPHLEASTAEASLLALWRFGLVFGLLLVPTSLMGGTFPVLVKVVSRRLEGLGGSVGRVYAANTIGAVVGCLAAGLVLIGELGLTATACAAVGLNGLAALLAWSVSGRPRYRAETAALAGSTAPDQAGQPSGRRVLCMAVALTGCVALGYEVVWSRALGLVLGHSIYAFTFVLSTYLAGLALGGWAASLFLDRLARPMHWFVAGLVLLAVVSGGGLFLVYGLPLRGYVLGDSPIPCILANLGATAILLLPPTLLLGALLPLAMKIYTAGLPCAGRDVGIIYAWNTVGSIAGSLLAGFLLIPFLGTQPAFFVLVLANLLVAVGLAWQAGWPRMGRLGLAVLTLAGVGCLATSSGSPIVRAKALERIEHGLGPVRVDFFAEDQVTTVGLCQDRHGTWFLFTGGDVMTHLGLETFWMAHLPLAFQDAPRDVLVLCLGMGNTFVAASQHPVRVTGVELSPQVVAAVHRVHGEHLKLDADRRLVVADARHVVSVTPALFDVITVDPPPPLYAAGTVNFHTLEFYERCRERIRPAGVVCQWIPFFSCTVDEYKMLLRTFRAAFDRMEVWIPSPVRGVSGLYLLGLGPACTPDRTLVQRRLASARVAADLRRLTEASLAQVAPLPVLTGADVDLVCGPGPIMTDDRPYLEFPLIRNAGVQEKVTFKLVYDYLKAQGRVATPLDR